MLRVPYHVNHDIYALADAIRISAWLTWPKTGQLVVDYMSFRDAWREHPASTREFREYTKIRQFMVINSLDYEDLLDIRQHHYTGKTLYRSIACVTKKYSL